jgi:hypothetical protein
MRPTRASALSVSMNPGGDDVDAHALRSDLVRQTLAVRRQGRLRRGIAQGRLVQRQVSLDRGDVHDCAPSAGDHAGQQSAVEPDRGQQVHGKLVLLCAVVECREAA